VPDGRVLVHNQLVPVVERNGARGSRYWLQLPADSLEVCDCGWAPELRLLGPPGGFSSWRTAYLCGSMHRVSGSSGWAACPLNP
jgi:hypothetical protein